MKKIILIAVLIIVFLALGAILKSKDSGLGKIKVGKMEIKTVFEHNGKIPSKYTCDGEDAAPELIISNVPETAKELVLIVDDPDAPMGTWVHWLVYNIPADTKAIDSKNLPAGAKQGRNDFQKLNWGGPCPPSGIHRYFFKLYALNKQMGLSEGLTKSQLETAIKDNVIEKTELIGLYQRQR